MSVWQLSGDDAGVLEDAIIKKDARLDRSSVVFRSLADDQAYLDACILMNAQLSAGSISRFIVRGVVGAGFDEQKVVSCLGMNGGVIEINKLPIDQTKNFLWIARNSKDRALSPEALDRFILEVNNNVRQQSNIEMTFQNGVDKFYEIAKQNKLRIVCNDPTGVFGTNRVDRKIYTGLMRGYFYATENSCAKYLGCSGYSTSWHYLFGLIDQHNNQLGTFMMAKWPWGIEATYTIMRPNRPKNLNCAQILMLFSQALVADKYNNELIYAESNLWNAKPCIQSGLLGLPSSLYGNTVTNVETADNMIRLDGELAEDAPDLVPPSYREAAYSCYGVHRLRNDLFTRSIVSQAEKLLA